MRLADFILHNTEPILADWETFARRIWPGTATDPAELRDHAEQILKAIARDMASAQTDAQRSDKSRGTPGGGSDSRRLDGASEKHGVGRVESGFNLLEVVSEYRALRASVIRLWRESEPTAEFRDLDDLTRFNESMDQSLTEAVASYTQRIDRSRQLFLGILGHDLRNPLNAMTMLTAGLCAGGQTEAETADTAARIQASAAAMARMINDLLDFTAAGLGGGMRVEPAAMDLGDLCRDVVDETRAAHPESPVLYEPADGGLSGEWDAARLRQLVSNLMGNAIQHGDAGRPVELSIDGRGADDVLLAVHNEGAPIPREALATIFDPLVRAGSPELNRRRRPGSIGLGLYIAREVATAHGGAIGVTSTQEDGTVFTVRLPRHGGGR